MQNPFISSRVSRSKHSKSAKPFTIVIGDTGIPAPTKKSVGDVRRLWMRDQYTIENIFNEIAQIALIGRRSIESGKPELLGELMDQNHEYLQALTVSSPELDKLVEAARNAGALGAKLSGSGRGGNMIALVDQAKAESVAGALISAGAKRTIITRNQRVRLHQSAPKYALPNHPMPDKKWLLPILPYIAVVGGIIFIQQRMARAAWVSMLNFDHARIYASQYSQLVFFSKANLPNGYCSVCWFAVPAELACTFSGTCLPLRLTCPRSLAPWA